MSLILNFSVYVWLVIILYSFAYLLELTAFKPIKKNMRSKIKKPLQFVYAFINVNWRISKLFIFSSSYFFSQFFHVYGITRYLALIKKKASCSLQTTYKLAMTSNYLLNQPLPFIQYAKSRTSRHTLFGSVRFYFNFAEQNKERNKRSWHGTVDARLN